MKKLYDPKTGKITEKPPITQRVSIYNPKYEPESYIEWADADRVAMAVRSARGGATQALFALYRDIILTDAHIQTELAKRKMAIIGDVMRVIPYDKKNAADIETAAFCERQIYEMKRWKFALSNLLDAVLWPVSVAEKAYTVDGSAYNLQGIHQVPYHLLDFSTGRLQIRNVDHEGQPVEGSTDPDPDRYIVHRGHLLSTPDHFGGPMRSLVYWWLCSTMTRDWWVRFLDRLGIPFMVGKYAAGNASDRNILLAAMAQSVKTFGVAISRETELELIEASKASADAFAAFMSVAQKEKSKLILGQTLSSTTDATGMGSGVADLQGDVREDIRKHDGSMLAETLRDQLLAQICQINRLPGRPPYLMFGRASDKEVDVAVKIVQALPAADLELDDDALEPFSEITGLTVRRRSIAGPRP
ncbi:MAG TPA: DUF935 family protein [Kiritimatiellia bacterium]|nr:DUF935 family protein [Kiritimatiellia bacterium]HMO99625.1 DUF935 family protein [Kiritimatiellia bacterium]HMP97128.1 DUF935 family protein [Kiritimatiellia bacterium]